MSFSFQNLGLYTDYYELLMAQGYFYSKKADEQAVFDYFFRTNPFHGGFTVFAGLEDFLSFLENFNFSSEDIYYLKENGFKKEFLDFLREFSFKGSVYNVREGEIVFPGEPILCVEGNLIETQLIESLLLNILNYESLIATKAFRTRLACGDRVFADFGLRRAPGLGALHASRAAWIGGASATSNVLAAKIFGIPLSGTQAHSWIQSFHSEAEAFEAFLNTNTDSAILLVDTYDTLKSGVPNAIVAAKKLEQNGHRLLGIRLDSGDLAYLSKQARTMLDHAGLDYVKIFASNQLNETVINSLLYDQQAPIDAFGVGTELVTGKPDAALDGVYKLAEIGGNPTMKFSENIIKETLPGKKALYRFSDHEGKFFRDGIHLYKENLSETEVLYHPFDPKKNTPVKGLAFENLHIKSFIKGKITGAGGTAPEAKKYLLKRADLLADEHKRFISPHLYKVGVSVNLLKLRNKLISND